MIMIFQAKKSPIINNNALKKQYFFMPLWPKSGICKVNSKY